MMGLELNNLEFGAADSGMPRINPDIAALNLASRRPAITPKNNNMDINSLETEMSGLITDMKKMLNDVDQMEFSPHLFKDVLDEMKDLPNMMEKTMNNAKNISFQSKGKKMPRKTVGQATAVKNAAARVGKAVLKPRQKEDDEETDDNEGDDEENQDEQKPKRRNNRQNKKVNQQDDDADNEGDDDQADDGEENEDDNNGAGDDLEEND